MLLSSIISLASLALYSCTPVDVPVVIEATSKEGDFFISFAISPDHASIIYATLPTKDEAAFFHPSQIKTAQQVLTADNIVLQCSDDSTKINFGCFWVKNGVNFANQVYFDIAPKTGALTIKNAANSKVRQCLVSGQYGYALSATGTCVTYSHF